MLWIILIGLFLGAVAAFWAVLLDDWMDYGEIFGIFRYKRLLKSLKKHGFNIDKTINPIMDMDYVDRQVAIRELIMTIAKYDFWITAWICRSCMSARFVILFLIPVVIYMLNLDHPIEHIFIIGICAFPTAHYLSQKL